MKRLLCLLGLLLLSSMLFANGSGDESASDRSKTDLELQIFIGGYGNEVWDAMIDGFRKAYPEYNLIINSGPKVNHEMRTRWVSNDPPDFIVVDGDDGGLFQTLWNEEQFMDLSSFMETRTLSDGKTLADKVVPAFLKSQKEIINGKVFIAPYVSYYWTFWYDDRNFGAKGIEIPDTVDEFIAYSKKSDTPLFAYAGVYPGYLSNPFFLSGIASEGGAELASAVYMGDRDAIRHPAVLRTAENMVKLIDAGVFMDGTVGLNHIESQMELLNGGALFVPSGTWLESEMKNDIPDGFTFRPMPSITRSSETQDYGASGGFNGFAIAKNAKNPEGAQDFISFLYEDEQVINWVNTTSAPTPLIIADPSQLKLTDGVKAVLEWMSRDDININAPIQYAAPSVEYSKTMEDSTNALVLQKITAQEFIDLIYEAAGK